MKKSIKILSTIALIAVMVVTGVMLVACGKSGDTIKISGSTSVFPIMEKLIEAYEKDHSGIKIELNGGGSSQGMKDAMNGTSDIGMASREVKDSEKTKLEATVIAQDGIAVILHKENPVSDLTLEQIKGIYTGSITNWNQVGGADNKINVISREAGSGTRAAFEEIVGYGEEDSKLVAGAQEINSTGTVKTTVSGDKASIGYISLASLDDSIQGCKVGSVEPTVANVIAKTYKIARPFNIATQKGAELSSEVQDFIKFIMSEAGQDIVEANGGIRVD